MNVKNRIFTFGVVLFSLLLTNSKLAQSQVSPTTQSPPNTNLSQSRESNWIGLASGTIVALIGFGFGLVQLRKSQYLKQENLQLQQRVEQEKLEFQQKLEQENLQLKQKLEQKKLESQQKLEQEKLAWEREKLTLEDENLHLQYDLRLERQRQDAELQKQLSEAEAEETAQSDTEAETIEAMTIEKETDVYRDKLLAELSNEKILELKRQHGKF